MIHRLNFVFLIWGFLGELNSLRAQDTHWDCNIHAYQYDMALYTALQLNENAAPLASSDYEIAAFCGEECRGVASLQTIASNSNTYYYLRVRSNKMQGEQITFKCYNRTSGLEQDIFTTVLFEENSVKGFPSQCFVLKTYPETAGIADNKINSDEELISVYFLDGTLFHARMKPDKFKMLPSGIYVINKKRIWIR